MTGSSTDGGSRLTAVAAPVEAHPLAFEVLEPEDALGIGYGADILIVDDDAANLTAYDAALSPLGRKLALAQSGLDALAKLLEQDFALILLDVSMPGMSGLETARMLHARPRCRGLPIIFITGMPPSSELILEAYEAGACDFVIKPVLPEILRAKAAVYLRLQERTQELLHQARQLRATHKRLAEADQQARQGNAAAVAARRLAKLQEATAGLAHAKTPHEVAAVAVRLGAEAVEASAAIMWLAQRDGSLVDAGSRGHPAAYLDLWGVIPAGAAVTPIHVLASRRPVWVEDEADLAREVPGALDQARTANHVRAFATLPLVSEGKGIAVLSYSYEGQHTFTDEDRTFLTALAHTCEQALERARLYEAEAEARQAAEALVQRKDELLAMLGHELRNPLAVMSSALDLIRLRAGTLGRELAIFDRQLVHLTHVVGDLVEVSRITRGRIRLDRTRVDLATAVGNAIEGTRSLIDAREHEVVVNVAEGLRLDADRHRLDQVLVNLLTNAATYTPRRGRIEVSADAEGTSIRILIRDNGQGMPATLLPHVFELFVQGERTPDRPDGGLGIGLTLVRTLVELHGGTIKAHSDGPGTGSTFTMWWPSPSPGDRTGRAPALAGRVVPLRVLLVDDNVDAVALFAELVGSFGHEVTVAHDAKSALEIAKDFGPQAALLDIGLPDLDGWELARQLRLLPSCVDTLLIAATGYDQVGDRDRSKRAGFDHHLVKPVDLATLEAVLQLASNSRSPSGGEAD